MSRTQELFRAIPGPLSAGAILSRMPSPEPAPASAPASAPEPEPDPAPEPAAAVDTEPEIPLGDLFLLTSRQVRHRWAASLTPWDLAPHQGRALRLVADLGPVRPGVLAEHLRIAPRSVTDVVDALEQRGLVERRPDPGDRRATVLRLTAAGRKVRAAIDASRRETVDDFFGWLSGPDQVTLRHLLVQLTTDDDAVAAGTSTRPIDQGHGAPTGAAAQGATR